MAFIRSRNSLVDTAIGSMLWIQNPVRPLRYPPGTRSRLSIALDNAGKSIDERYDHMHWIIKVVFG